MSALKNIFAVLLLLTFASPAFADLASDKVTVDAAKASGVVGEQADGYLGIVSSADATVTAAVNEINAARANVYADTAAKTGTSRDAASQATGVQLIARTPAGQYVKPLGGNWRKK